MIKKEPHVTFEGKKQLQTLALELSKELAEIAEDLHFYTQEKLESGYDIFNFIIGAIKNLTFEALPDYEHRLDKLEKQYVHCGAIVWD